MMTKIKKSACLLIVVTISILSGNLVCAQQQGPPPIPDSSQIKEMVTELSETLALSTEQSEQITELYTTHFKKINEKMKSGKPNRDEMDTLKSEFEKKLKSILTDEQQVKFEDFMKKHEPQRPQR